MQTTHRGVAARRGLAAAMTLLLALTGLVAGASAAQAAEINWTVPDEPVVVTAGEQMTSLLVGGGFVQQALGTAPVRTSSDGLPAGLALDATSTCSQIFPGAFMCAGFVTLYGRPSVPGTYRATLGMTMAGTSSTHPITIVVEPGDPSAASSEISGTDGDRVADGVDAHEVRAVVRSSAGVPLSGLSHDEVVRAVGLGHTGVGALGAFVEEETGEYVARVTSREAGTARVTATAPGGPLELPFVAPYSPERSELTVSTGARSANGTHAHTVVLELRDHAGEALRGLDDAEVRALTGISVTGADLGPFTYSGVAHYSAPLTSTTVGVATVTAQATNSPRSAEFAEPIALSPGAVDVASGAQGVVLDVLANGRGTGVRVIGAALADPDAGSVRSVLAGQHLELDVAPGFTGATVVTYEARDTFGFTARSTVDVTVHGPPAVEDRAERIPRDGSFALAAEDLLAPGAARPATVTGVSAEHGSATLVVGEVRYRAAAGFTGTDRVTVTATDDLGQTGTGTITVEVVAPPAPDRYVRTVLSGTELVLTPDELGVAGLTYVGGDEQLDDDVTFEHQDDGTYRYGTALGYAAEHTWTATYADDLGQTGTLTVVLTSDDPAALHVSHGLRAADGSHAHDVTLTLTDHEGAARAGLTDEEVRTVTRVGVDGGDLGAFEEPEPGVYVAPLVSTSVGTAVVTVEARGLSAEARFAEAIALVPDEVTLPSGAVDAVVDVLANDHGTGLRVTGVQVDEPDAAEVTVGPGGAHVLVTTAPGFSGELTLTYDAEDVFGFTASATVRVTVQELPVDPGGPDPGGPDEGGPDEGGPGEGGPGEGGTGGDGSGGAQEGGGDGTDGARDGDRGSGGHEDGLALTGPAVVALVCLVVLLVAAGTVLVGIRRRCEPGRPDPA